MDAFIDLAQHCAPAFPVETLAAVVSNQSGFNPLAIRINTGLPLERPPVSKAEAIEIATALVAEGQNVDLGLGGINSQLLRKAGLTIGAAFDACANLEATASLLSSYYRAAVRGGAGEGVAQNLMLVSYFGAGDAEAGRLAGYDKRVAAEGRRLAGRLSSIRLATPASRPPTGQFTDPAEATADAPARASRRQVAPKATPPQWDVFATTRSSSILVFSNGR